MGKVCDTQATISNPMHLGYFLPSEGNKHKGRILPDDEEAAAPPWAACLEAFWGEQKEAL